MLNEQRSEHDRKSSCGQASFSKHRTAMLAVFQPFHYFPLVIFSSHTRLHYLLVDDSAVLHADHFYEDYFLNIDILVALECVQISCLLFLSF